MREGVVNAQRSSEPPECLDRVLMHGGRGDGDEVIVQGVPAPQAQGRHLVPEKTSQFIIDYIIGLCSG